MTSEMPDELLKFGQRALMDAVIRKRKQDFAGYCRTLSDRQVEGIIEKEQRYADVDEFRADCLQIALDEAECRELDV